MDKDRAMEVIIGETLKDYVNLFLGEGELANEDKELVSSLIRVIEYVSLHGDFKKYAEANKDRIDVALGNGKLASNSFTVTCVEENEDGSANVEVEMGDEVRSKMFEEGLNFLLIKAILGGDTEDVLRWAQRGKTPVDNGLETVYI
jgi:hypothetical protein